MQQPKAQCRFALSKEYHRKIMIQIICHVPTRSVGRLPIGFRVIGGFVLSTLKPAVVSKCIYIYISTSGAFCMYKMFQWHLLNVYQVDRAQGSFCVCAQPMRDDDTTSPFLTDWVHTQMIPGHHVERRSTLECIHYLSQQTWYFHILFTHSLQGCSYWH